MSGNKMTYDRALGVIEYNYGLGTMLGDPEWTHEMADMLASEEDKRTACETHHLDYPPAAWWDSYFGNEES